MIKFVDGKTSDIRLHDIECGETFTVVNGGKPYTPAVKVDDVFIKVDPRKYDCNKYSSAILILNLRTGKLHRWRDDLPIIRVDVDATVHPIEEKKI